MGKTQRKAVTEPDADPPLFGPADAWTHAVRDRLVRLAFRFLWNRHDAEEVAHDVLATAWEKMDTLRDPDKTWPWLCRVTVHRCHQMGRRQRRDERATTAMWQKAARVADGEASHGPDRVRFAELTDLLKTRLLDLSPRQRDVIVLRYLEGMAYERIADVLRISPVTARVHARAGLERLRLMMAPGHPDTAVSTDRRSDRP